MTTRKVFTLSLCHLVTWSLLLGSAARGEEYLLQTNGAAKRGTLEQLDDNWSVRLGGAEAVRVHGNDVVEWRRVDGVLPPPPRGEQLVFANGDRVPARIVKATGDAVRYAWPAGWEGAADVEAPLTAVAVLWLRTPEGVADGATYLRQLAAARRAHDQVILQNGDVLEGVLTDLDEKAVRIEVGMRTTAVERGKVAAVALTTDLAEPLRPRGLYARLVLANGARLSLRSATCTDGKTLKGVTLFEAPVRIPLAEVVAAYYFQGRAVYLSDLKPAQYEFSPYLDVRYPLVVDGSVAGQDLRQNGSVYDKGLGTHSACRVRYDLRGGYRRFEALVGLDDRGGRDGSVRVQVLVDSKPHDPLRGKELTHASGAVPIQIDVTGAKELTLVVDFGRRGDVQDHVNWADARLVK